MANLAPNNFLDTEIIFHVGVERTGTKYLQNTVFPTYTDLCYLNKDKYTKAKKIIAQKKHKKYLVSMELNLNNHFEDEVKSFSETFPNAKVIMVVRQQHSWLASHYKRIVKNGNNITFTDMLNFDGGESIYTTSDMHYMQKMAYLEKHFTQKPLYLLYGDLKKDPIAYLKKIANYVQVPFNKDVISLKRRHASYSIKQLKALQKVMKYVHISRNKPTKNKIINLFYRLYVDAIRYATMYTAKKLPDSYFSTDPFIKPDELEKVKQFYLKDWLATQKYIQDASN